MKQVDLERQLVFSRTPESKRKEREQLQRDVEQYLASGKEITKLPTGADDGQQA